MRELLAKALLPGGEEEARVRRILAASFFRTRPMQAGACAQVIPLGERSTREGFLGRNGGMGR